MERNIFCSLFKYRPNNCVTPEENFVTESFIYLLYLSLHTDKALLQSFFGLLDPELLLKNTDNISIETQRVFDTDLGVIAIPDITISVNRNIYFIEVKVSSELNTYEVLNNENIESINQIQKYSQIKTMGFNKHIYTLTVYNLKINQEINGFKKSILWNDVYYLLDRLKTNNNFFNFRI